MRSVLRKLLIVVAVLLVVAAAGIAYVASRLGPLAREYVGTALEDKFKSDVELGTLDIVFRPEPAATATGVLIRHRGRTDVPPLLTIKRLEIKAHYWDLWATPKRISLVRFEGLEINMPPKGRRKQVGAAEPPPPTPRDARKAAPEFVIERVIADGTVLNVLPKDEGKEPLVWDIKKLTLDSVGPGKPMTYKATLVNAKPPGDIQATGRFGPWNGEDPGQSLVEGDYTFSNADLSVFKGIAGILSSTGNFRGVLERIEADGETDTPDFRLDAVGNPVPLKTKFHAVIDGTSGDTYLEPVNAKLGSSTIVCRGAVAGKPGVKGKTVSMAVSINPAKIEDLLRLTVKGKGSPMVGGLKSQARMVIPPGEADVIEKLRLTGTFYMDNVQFTTPVIQDKLNEMSQRARGEHDPAPERVASKFGGDFTLGGGQIALRGLTFIVPGAMARLDGGYGIRSEVIDFSGTLRMQAKVSQTVTGMKSVLLKAVDPFFAKAGAGAVIPIKISGTREDPKFGLNLRAGKEKEAEEERSRKK